MVRGRPPNVRGARGVLTEPRRHFVIFNPASGRGRGRRRLSSYRSLLEESLDDVTFGATTRPGEERDLAERAVEEGYDVVVAVGGDGTWSNVADRLVASGKEDVAFGILPSGTGNDFGRNLGLGPKDPEGAVRTLAAGVTRRVDVGRLESFSASEHAPNRQEPRHFLNLIGFGFDVAVIDAAAGARFLKGELLYKITALQQLFRFAGLEAGVDTSRGESRHDEHLMITVSNGRFFGGGFPIAPEASLDDGMLHTCRILDAPPLTRLKLFSLAEKGRHTASDKVEVLADPAFQLTFEEPPRFEMDGDVRRASGEVLDVRVVPRALKVISPAKADAQD